MGKMSELSLLLDEYREANRRAAELADEISAMLTGTEPPAHEAHEEAKSLTLEEVRAVLADKSKDGFTAQIRELLKKYGADRMSAIDPANYRAQATALSSRTASFTSSTTNTVAGCLSKPKKIRK